MSVLAWEEGVTKNSPTPEAGSGTEFDAWVGRQSSAPVDWQIGRSELGPGLPIYQSTGSQSAIYLAMLRLFRDSLVRDSLRALFQLAESLCFHRETAGAPHVLECLVI